MKYILVIISCIAFIGCTPKTVPQHQDIAYQRNGQVRYIQSEGSALYFESINIGSTSSEAVYHSVVSTIENILFKGIPKSPSEVPMISDENKAMEAHGLALKKIIYETGPNQFVTSSSILEEEKIANGIRSVVEVAIDTKALRRELEKQSIIPKLGL